jgi:hypothetical protein
MRLRQRILHIRIVRSFVSQCAGFAVAGEEGGFRIETPDPADRRLERGHVGVRQIGKADGAYEPWNRDVSDYAVLGQSSFPAIVCDVCYNPRIRSSA